MKKKFDQRLIILDENVFFFFTNLVLQTRYEPNQPVLQSATRREILPFERTLRLARMYMYVYGRKLGEKGGGRARSLCDSTSRQVDTYLRDRVARAPLSSYACVCVTHARAHGASRSALPDNKCDFFFLCRDKILYCIQQSHGGVY